MNRQEFIEYIKTHYKAEPEFPWNKHPSYVVFRHKSNNKWFVIIMDVPINKLCRDEIENSNIVSIINIKIAPELTSDLRSRKGVYPAYHMNKEHWISIRLDSDINNIELKLLVENSYKLTN